MTDLKPCPFCGGEGREVGGCASTACSACGSYSREEVRCVQCNASAVDAEDWNTRPVPELLEGYREECRSTALHLMRRDVAGEYTVAIWRTSHNYLAFPGNGMDDSHAQALAIWLQRRNHD